MPKHCGERYDPALRQTEHGSRLYQTWRKVQKAPHCEEWDNFPVFHDWAIKNGYAIGSWLCMVDKNKPYEPSNCVWYVPGKDEKNVQPSWADKWNNTVNRIRKHYGMPPLEGTEYGD